MKPRNVSGWVKLAAVLPLLGAGMLGACEDETEPTPPVGGPGGSGGSAMVMGGAGGSGTSTEVAVTADITADTTWSQPVYVLKQKIYVTNNARLTIAAGTKVLGDAGTTADNKPALIVSRGAQLIAVGTADKPIVFTSGAADGSRKGGDWAGVALLGSARINTGMPCASGAAGCLESGIEGIPASELKAKFGGTDDASSCGELEYVRIEFAGAELEPTRELNGLTLGGCGEGTKLSYLQVHRGTDDGIEFFGGKASMDHVVLSGNEDDSLDWDFGWSGKVQFLVIHQRAGFGDNGIEGAGSPSSETAEPRTAPVLTNVTMIGREGGGRAMTLKEGTRGKMTNFIVQGFKGDVIDFQARTVDLAMEWPAQLSVESSLFWNNAAYSNETGTNAMGQSLDDDKGFDDKAAIESAERSNKLDVDPQITVSDTAPNYVPKAAGADGPFATPTFGVTAATYAGAFKANDPAPWTATWTAFPAN